MEVSWDRPPFLNKKKMPHVKKDQRVINPTVKEVLARNTKFIDENQQSVCVVKKKSGVIFAFSKEMLQSLHI